MMERLGLPYLGFGLGLRAEHYDTVLNQWPAVDWFEIISENFLETEGHTKRILGEIRERYPIVMHGVSLSVGSTDSLNIPYLQKLKKLAEWLQPPWVSDHLCWTGINHVNTHDLLPVPYTEESLAHTIKRIKHIQDILERPLILENPSTYLEFKDSSIPEAEFIATMAKESGCGLLLDINNVYVSCYNHRWDAKAYLDALPLERVVQIHLAGHENHGTHIVDTHDGHVIEEVWQLYHYVIGKTSDISTMIEWDANIPEFAVLQAELDKARLHAERPLNVTTFTGDNGGEPLPARPYNVILSTMQTGILAGTTAQAEEWIRPKRDFPAAAQLGVYINGYRYRLCDAVSEDFPATRHALGDEVMNRLIQDYVESTPSQFFDLGHYVKRFPGFISAHVSPFATELAHAEQASHTIFSLPESEPIALEAFAALAPEALMAAHLKPRTASLLLAHHYPTNDYLTAYHNDQSPALPEAQASYMLVYRHNDSTWRIGLEHGEYLLLSHLNADLPMGEAIEATAAQLDGLTEEEFLEKLQQWFGRWVASGVLGEDSGFGIQDSEDFLHIEKPKKTSDL